MIELGVSKVRITPPIGVPMDGYLSRRMPSIGVHDHIYVRSLVLGDGVNFVALSSLELLYVTRDISSPVEEVVESELGIPRDSIIISAVHNHSGPSVTGFHSVEQYRFLDEYLGLLPGAISSSIIEAYNRRRRVRIGYGRGRFDRWIVNRRKPKSGPLDDELIVFKAEDEYGRTIASIVNFACHAVVLGSNNLMITGDYPGYLSRTVESIEGGVCLFLNGAFGDINPYTPSTILERVYDRSIGSFDDAIRMGKALGCEAAKIMELSSSMEEASFSYASTTVKLKLRPIPAMDGGGSLDRLTLRIRRTIEKLFPHGEAEVSIRGFRLGDLGLVALPGELFVELGLSIKKSSPFGYTMIAGCSTGELGYIPTDEAYDEGGYEVSIPVCLVERGSGEKLVEASIDLLRKLYSS
jgi:hypothetical protein